MTKEAHKSAFTTGSIMKHVIIMSLTGSIGLMALFLVDLIDLYFLSILGNVELASAVGYAGTILYFTTSVSIGLSIGTGAVISKSVGAKQFLKAKRYLINIYAASFIICLFISIFVYTYIPELLALLGASKESSLVAQKYLKIMVPSIPLMGLSMVSMAALRAVGDAKRSMFATLSSAGVNAILDPILIFTLALGIEGAAIASVLARLTMFLVATYPVYKHHDLIIKFSTKEIIPYLKDFFQIAVPSIITNIATPVGVGYVTKIMATFGDSAIAGMSIVSRLTPVIFGVIFALSGAVGPIIGQNLGAKYMSRVKDTVIDSFKFLFVYVSIISVVLLFLPNWITQVFAMDEKAGEVIKVFCHYVSITYIFAGATFVANAAFNNLGKPQNSTILNVSKATLGTIPFVYYGSLWYGPTGVLVGQAIGAVFIGVISVIWVMKHIQNLKNKID